ncbi:MAG: penicillin-binding protein 2 [Actinomycetaceae bacterium]|nr:penicillin-binding protein 2 [Actinomycetaceae bacterium]
MNPQIRRLTYVIVAMFVTLMCALTYHQVLDAPKLNADPRNARAIYATYGRDRGSIIVQGEAVASSTKSDDAYKYQRHYKPGSLYALSTGYYSTAFSSTTGLEKEMNRVLDGTSTTLLRSRIQRLFTGAQPQGGSVELTLNATAQQAAAKALGDKRGAVVALDPKTGAILALYSSPSFDPNALATHDSAKAQEAYDAMLKDPNQPLENRAFGGHRYAPGSTFKIITAAAMLESGNYTPDTKIDSPVSIPLPGTQSTLANDNNEHCGDGHPSLSLAFALSCNTTFAKAGMELGEQALAKKAADFGFGNTPTIPLVGAPSVFPKDMAQAQVAMSAIGQFDVSVTPLQMVEVAATVANGGTHMKPYLVSRILDADLAEQDKTTPTKAGQPISADTATKLTRMMVGVTQRGTGKAAAIPGIEVAGKTGTAERGDVADAWFVGFAPANQPQVAVAVIVEGGQGSAVAYGGEVAAPVAKAVMGAIIK